MPSGFREWKGVPRVFIKGFMPTSEPVIGVRLSIPNDALHLSVFAFNNRWTTLLLWRLLRSRIEATGIPVTTSGCAFPFYRSFYRFEVVTAPIAPLTAVRDELEGLSLLNFAQIALWDGRELVWRIFHPAEPGIFMGPTEEELGAESREIARDQEIIHKLDQQDAAAGQ